MYIRRMEREWKPSVETSPACPRCGSANTKFCYYNNYSLTQPRYFCKACRRYWTKGGSLRNVPVGGGCRKSRRGKSSVRVAGVASRTAATLPQGRIESSRSNSPRPADTCATIDLAAVYANFLNQPPQVENRIEADIVVPSPSSLQQGFTDFSGLDISQMNLENTCTGFLECGQLTGNLSETRLLEDGNPIYNCDGYEDFNRTQQQLVGGANDGNFSSITIYPMENAAALPPLPGEDDRGGSDGHGLLWPVGPDVVLSDQILAPASNNYHGMAAGAGSGEPGGLNSDVLNGEMNPFSPLNLEAIFRS